MWEWSRTVVERAVAATWQSVRVVEPRPTVTDPEPWAVAAVVEPEESEGDMASAGNARGGSVDYCLAG
jgi:hypothetical protein